MLINLSFLSKFGSITSKSGCTFDSINLQALWSLSQIKFELEADNKNLANEYANVAFPTPSLPENK